MLSVITIDYSMMSINPILSETTLEFMLDKTKSFLVPKFNENLNILTNSTSFITSEASFDDV